jgi:hypothetical protein
VGRGRAAGASAQAPANWRSSNAVLRCRRIHSARTIASAFSSNASVSVSVVIFLTPFEKVARR